MKDAAKFRAYIDEYYQQYPELFPEGFAKGYRLHDTRKSKKMADVVIRRIKFTNGEVYSIVPCDIMPYLTGKTQEVSKGLILRKYGVPYEVIAQLLGRNAMYWQRLEASLGRISLVGSLCKKQIPAHLAADEKITFINGQEAYVALTAAKDCVLGADISVSEDTQGLQAAYGVFKREVQVLQADYQPISVNLDGWRPTNKAWKALFENILIILCFLHGFLKIRDVAKHLKEDFTLLSTGLWQSYQKKTAQEFEQALAQILSWAEQKLIKQERVLNKLREVVGKATAFSCAYNYAACYRTSNQIDRPMNLLDRYLYQTRYFHGHVSSANLKIRAWAMLYNFSPFGERTQKQNKKSRFEQLNGFVYHQDWLQNLLIASSLNGFAIHHKKR